MKRKPNPKRAELIKLSNQAKLALQLGDETAMMVDNPTVNNLVMALFYPSGVYHTYKDWKESGYQVKKGSKAYPVWGRKRKMEKKVIDDHGNDDIHKFSAFPIANLFNESQVEAI